MSPGLVVAIAALASPFVLIPSSRAMMDTDDSGKRYLDPMVLCILCICYLAFTYGIVALIANSSKCGFSSDHYSRYKWVGNSCVDTYNEPLQLHA